ncbi:MAG: four helix bundle protein [Bacteroidales bacterium]|nr:four helix bundle protein [Bacteroidales bacterium]
MYKFSFEKLKAWQSARALTRKVYSLTKKFPKSEEFCLTNQVRRAAISVCSNLAEGSSRRSKKEQNHFYQVAYSSLMELLNQLIISNDIEYIDSGELSELREEVRQISLLISRLRQYNQE